MEQELKGLIFLNVPAETIRFSNSGSVPSKKDLKNAKVHSDYLLQHIKECIESSSEDENIVYSDHGVYLEFCSDSNSELKKDRLNNKKAHVRLLNVRTVETGDVVFEKATVFVPEQKKDYFTEKIEQYRDTCDDAKTKNRELIDSIADISSPSFASFWIGKKEQIPNVEPSWCEIWIAKEKNKSVEQRFESVCITLNIEIQMNVRLEFAQSIVRVVKANLEQLKMLLKKYECVNEIRPCQECAAFFDSLDTKEQKEWVNDLLERTVFSDSRVTVTLLDAGLNSHPLIDRAINSDDDVMPFEPGLAATDEYDGHGMSMAGVVLYNDLSVALASKSAISIGHKIESVKIYNKKNPITVMHGDAIQRAVYNAEIHDPTRKRLFCSSLTASDDVVGDGHPTSWSAALDLLAFSDSKDHKRLFIVSSGNVDLNELKGLADDDIRSLCSVKTPAQSWNAISVGAYSGKDRVIDDAYKNCEVYSKSMDLSPYNTTSLTWNNRWPIKPDVVFEGGNMVKDSDGLYSSCPDLDVLTTRSDNLNRGYYFTTFSGTSAASASAANFCAQILCAYPSLWPETVRALLIHSASWSKPMKDRFLLGEKTAKEERGNMVRSCGYGIPDLKKALYCLSNSVSLVIQDSILLYSKKDRDKKPSLNMNLYEIPWPKDVLLQMGQANANLKVTLSYFIEPNPSERGYKSKYRYQSFGLRFDVNKPGESKDQFLSRINKEFRDEKGEKHRGNDWYIGQKSDVGSVHSDFIESTAAGIADQKYVAIFPVNGWWENNDKRDFSVRYSVIISVETPEVECDLYTPIMVQIENAIKV